VIGLIVVGLTLVLASVVGLRLQRAGRRLALEKVAVGGTGDGPAVLNPTDLGAELGARATLVQFSSAFCAPCRTTRVVLGDVSRLVDGVTYVEVDAESNLELVRRLDVRRTPTVLVLDASGAVVRRASGAPRKADVLAALGVAVA
jgi:thiol-disulfide isomerase/thioredoxin